MAEDATRVSRAVLGAAHRAAAWGASEEEPGIWGPSGVQQPSWARGVWVQGQCRHRECLWTQTQCANCRSSLARGSPETPRACLRGGGGHKGTLLGPSPRSPARGTCAGGNRLRPCSRGPSTAQNRGNGSRTPWVGRSTAPALKCSAAQDFARLGSCFPTATREGPSGTLEKCRQVSSSPGSSWGWGTPIPCGPAFPDGEGWTCSGLCGSQLSG